MMSLDTTAEARQVQLDLLRRMGSQGRLQQALELSEVSCQLLVAGVRQRHPEYAEEEVWREVVRLQLPAGLYPRIHPHTTSVMTMKPEETLKLVIEHFKTAGIEYMITGSFASNLHGVPRTTQDADVVIEVSDKSLEQFLSLIEGEFYVSEEAAREALRRRDMFNIIHLNTAFKVDLIVRKQRTYAKEEFRRRQSVEFLGKECWFASPEDTILAKLEWSKKGQSERQYQDALGVADIQQDALDWGYLQTWGERLGIGNLCSRLRHEAEQK